MECAAACSIKAIEKYLFLVRQYYYTKILFKYILLYVKG